VVITDVNQVTYQGDGSTTVFPFSFPIVASTDIRLILQDADGTQTDIVSDYYVSGGTVKYPGYAPGEEPDPGEQPPKVQDGQKLIIYRDVPITQEADLGDVWPFYVIEQMVDKCTMILQDLFGTVARCLKVRVSDIDFDTTITPEAGKAIEINADGTGFVCIESPSTILHQCEAVRDQVVDEAGQVAEDAAHTQTWAGTASNAADAAVQANNSVQGALIDAQTLLDATKGYISAATEDALWNSATEYDPGDVVMTSNGAVYRCIQTSTNNPPESSPAYWVPVTTVELYTFEYDEYGDLMPRINPNASECWEIDGNGDIEPAA